MAVKNRYEGCFTNSWYWAQTLGEGGHGLVKLVRVYRV